MSKHSSVLVRRSPRRTPIIICGRTRQTQWKQAFTLNGCPYIVGRVPRSLNSREAGFEGLLRENISTKVISLSRDGPVKRDITHHEWTYWLSTESFIKVYLPDISYFSFVTPREENTPRPPTPSSPNGI